VIIPALSTNIEEEKVFLLFPFPWKYIPGFAPLASIKGAQNLKKIFPSPV